MTEPTTTIDQQLLLNAAWEMLVALEHLRQVIDTPLTSKGFAVRLVEARVRADEAIGKARGFWPNQEAPG